MSKNKFEIGEKAKLGKEEVEIKVAKRNFIARTTQYVLVSGETVNEDQLKRIAERKPKGGGNPEVEVVRAQYLEVTNKKVPSNMKNNVEWMKEKIAEVSTTTDWDLLLPLDDVALVDFIKVKELDIDSADYDSTDVLRVAIAEEMEIEIPK